jgi:hypothetical protein
MEIIVKNNDAVKAYRVLMKKLNNEYNGNFFKFLQEIEVYKPKSLKRILKNKKAVLEIKKEREKRHHSFEKEEQRQIIDSKKRAKEFKKNQAAKKN